MSTSPLIDPATSGDHDTQPIQHTTPPNTTTAPLSGVEEVDATILSYLSIEGLHALTFDQQTSPTPSGRLLADDSRVWASLLGMALGIDIVHGRGIPYRTLYLAVTMKTNQVYPAEDRGSNEHLEGRLVMLDYAIYSVKAAVERDGGNLCSPGRETLGLLIAVLDCIIYYHMPWDVSNAVDTMSSVFVRVLDTLAKVGCLLGWEAMIARLLGLPLPPDFPMTQYRYDHRTIMRLVSIIRLSSKYIWMDICRLMQYHEVAVDTLERLTTTYLWHSLATKVGNTHWPQGGYDYVIGALRCSVQEKCNPSHFLPNPFPQDRRRPKTMFSVSIADREMGLKAAASSPERLHFFLYYLLTLTSVGTIGLSIGDMVEAFLLSSYRPADDYSTLDVLHAGLGITDLTRRLPESSSDRRDDHYAKVPAALDVSTTVELILIRTFVARIRSQDQANRFMTYVARNCLVQTVVEEAERLGAPRSHGTQHRMHPYDSALMKSTKESSVVVLPNLTIHRHHFPYPYLMAMYDAFCGHLDPGTLDMLLMGSDVSVHGLPCDRDDNLIYIAEALVLGQTIKETNTSDQGYVTLTHIVATAARTLSSIGTMVRKSTKLPEDHAMHGTIYGIIAAAMYDESLFTAMLHLLAPNEANDETRVDLLVRACAIQYAKAVHSIPDNQPETAVHRQCMVMLEDYYDNITPILERWDVSRSQEELHLARIGSVGANISYTCMYTNYPGHLLWQYACTVEDPVVTSALLPFAECRRSSRLTEAYSAKNLLWMDYNIALRLPYPRDYANLVVVGMRLPSHKDNVEASGDSDGSAHQRYLGWLRGLLSHLWDVELYDELAGCIELMRRTRGMMRYTEGRMK